MARGLGTPGGVVTDEDHRLAMAGLVAPQSSSLAVRTGVLYAPGAATLVTGTSATGTMTVNVAAHHWVTTRGAADGIYIGALEAATTANIAAAPGANSRIDVVYVKQNDSASTVSPDGSTTFTVGVTTGTAAVSPTKPAIPVGAQEIATVTVATGATATNGAGVTIANTAPLTVARGARVPVRSLTERNALTQYAGLEVYRLDNGQVQLSNGSTWATTYDPTAAGAPFALRYGAPAATQAAATSGSLKTLNLASVQQASNISTVPASGRIVATVPGWYLVSGSVGFAASGVGRRVAGILKNGTLIAPSQNASLPSNNSIILATSTIPVQLNAGDYVQVGGFHDVGTNLDFLLDASFLQATYIRA